MKRDTHRRTDGTAKDRASVYAHWQALLDVRNAKPPEPLPTENHTCLKCGGTFAVRIGRTTPKQCPICQRIKWNDPTAKRLERRV